MIKVAVILFLVLMIIFILLKFSMNRNFTDNTVIIDKVDYDKGVFHLIDSKGHKYFGTLQGVNWPKKRETVLDVKKIITNARKNSIAFSKNEDELIIWVQTSSGSKSLNEMLLKVVN